MVRASEKKGKVFNLYWIICRGMEEEETRSSVLLGRAGMNNNFKFKMNPISHGFYPAKLETNKNNRNTFDLIRAQPRATEGFNFNLRFSLIVRKCPK